jgi:hypothetical protein
MLIIFFIKNFVFNKLQLTEASRGVEALEARGVRTAS